MSILQFIDLACLGVIFGTWLQLTMDAGMLAYLGWRQGVATAVLIVMTCSVGILMIEDMMQPYSPRFGEFAMHAALAMWNAMILFRLIRGTSDSVRSP